MSARMVIGDVFDCLAATPDGSVDLILTSPPFLALRSYLPADHPDKAKEIGSEPDPATFIDTLLALSAEWRRVLAPHGSIAVELGDTYAGSGGAGGDYDTGQVRGGQQKFAGSALKDRKNKVLNANGQRMQQGDGWPEAKSLALVPESYRLALAYGRNPITGTESPAGRWKVRNVVRWCRPNPPVGALGDKFRPGTSDMVIACVSGKRYFDLDAVRTPTDSTKPGGLRKGTPHGTDERRADAGETANMSGSNPAGAPPLDWWEVSAERYSGSHYATWPRKLLTRPILAMCPQRVCLVCGEPSRRIVDVEGLSGRCFLGKSPDPGVGLQGERPSVPDVAIRETLGWSTCGHDAWRNGIVLDPFAGSGTTLAVATGLGRDAVGFDLDERNAALAMERVGMFLTVDHLERAS